VPVQPPRGLHPWHDIPTGRSPPDELTAVIEIPTNERNKYELDKELGIYGFLPRTLGDDGDPLDGLVVMTIPVFTGCLVDARPIGLFHLVDRGVAGDRALLPGLQGLGGDTHEDERARGSG
jgi:inorganic pyrophosphatase